MPDGIRLSSRARSALDAICDSFARPHGLGREPMVTIEALAHMNARAIAAKLS